MTRFLKMFRILMPGIAGIVLVTGCSSLNQSAPVATDEAILRIGVAANYPPIIYKRDDAFTGVEADLAKGLAMALGRDPVFIEMKWENLIPALNGGKIDIIMSGMSVTAARELQVAFCTPYLRNGLMAAVPAAAVRNYRSPADLLFTRERVGVVKNTTGEAFARRFMSNAEIVPLKEASEAADFFDGNRIGVFVHDAYAIGWLVSQHESTIAGIWSPLSNDYLAWAVSRGNPKLLKQVNHVLEEWKSIGTLDTVLDRWLPGRNRIQWDINARTPRRSGARVLGY